MKTVDFLYIATALCPERPFIVFGDTKRSFAEFSERAEKLSWTLAGLGIRKGDRVAALHVNCPEYIEIYFASAMIGAIFVPLNFRAKSNELAYMIGNAQVKAVFAGARYLQQLEPVRSALESVSTYVSIDQRCEGVTYYEDLLAQATPVEATEESEDDDVTILMYTAGTTGRPKAVPLRHSGFASYVLENLEPASPAIEERNLLTVPLYHVAGIQAMFAAVYGGRTLVLMPQFEVTEWLNAVQDHRVTRAMLVPTMLKWVVEHPELHRFDLSSLKVITYGAAPMPLSVITRAIEELPGVQFVNAFGQTETASTITALGPEDHIIAGTPAEKEKRMRRLASSIGRPLSDVEIKIADGEGNVLPLGETGEICAKGPRVMTGYWQDVERSSQVIGEDGWLRTGDQGWMDEEGYIYLAGRGDDMIIRGGENISPEEIEDVLHAHPKVEEAAVIGVPDPEWGQEPRAIVVTKRGEKLEPVELIEYCHARLASYKRPRSVVFVDALPRNHMGKVLKRILREQYGKD